MAKRKRLFPAPSPAAETKSAPLPPPAAAPMAAPIAQVAGAASEAAAAREMSDFLADARAKGLLLVTLRLDQVERAHLERDRLAVDPEDEDMAALVASIRARGQQAPIEVVRITGDPRERYGLVSGMRRLTALRMLLEETGEARFGRVVARVLERRGAADAYLAMVEENEIRADLSFWERARVVVKAVEAGAWEDRRAALRGLYGNVARAKRSKIGRFVDLVEALDGALRFPAALSEKRGLALAAALEAEGAAARLRAALEAAAPESAEAEQAAIARALPDGTRAAGRRAAAPRAAPAAVSVAREGDRLVLSGPGVDAALARELKAWLKARGEGADGAA